MKLQKNLKLHIQEQSLEIFLEFEQAYSPDWQKEAYAENFTKIRPQRAKL